MNHFAMKLVLTGPIFPVRGVRAYDPELDCITSLLSDACEALEETGQVRFDVAGFGQERWPLDVRTDLAVAVEQVPAVIEALVSGEPVTLDFYEQGVQRELDMTPQSSEVTIYCGSMTDWRPDPDTIHMPIHELQAQLEQFLDGFVDVVRQRCPDLVEHPWFRDWYIKRG